MLLGFVAEFLRAMGLYSSFAVIAVTSGPSNICLKKGRVYEACANFFFWTVC